jgi:hypothetical protein
LLVAAEIQDKSFILLALALTFLAAHRRVSPEQCESFGVQDVHTHQQIQAMYKEY